VLRGKGNLTFHPGKWNWKFEQKFDDNQLYALSECRIRRITFWLGAGKEEWLLHRDYSEYDPHGALSQYRL
jgi:hypothetical protein